MTVTGVVISSQSSNRLWKSNPKLDVRLSSIFCRVPLTQVLQSCLSWKAGKSFGLKKLIRRVGLVFFRSKTRENICTTTHKNVKIVKRCLHPLIMHSRTLNGYICSFWRNVHQKERCSNIYFPYVYKMGNNIRYSKRLTCSLKAYKASKLLT